MMKEDNKIKVVDIENLKQDDKNFNRGTKRGKKLMERSLKELGLGRSILIDKDNNIIAGNKTQETAKELGFKNVIVVETDGSQVVAVKRTDLSLKTKKGRELALADNRTAQENIDLDYIKIKEELDNEILKAYDVKEPATSKGGLTDLYNECKLYNKAMVTPIQFPSAIYAERQVMNGNRLHHRIMYRYLAPKLLKSKDRSNIAWDTYEEDYPFTNEPKRD